MRGGLERWKRGVGSQGVRQALAYAFDGSCDSHIRTTSGVNALADYSDVAAAGVSRFTVEAGVISADLLGPAELRRWVDGYDPDTGERRGRDLSSPDADLILDGTINAPKSYSIAALLDPDLAREFEQLQDRLRDRVVLIWQRELNARRGAGGRVREALDRVEVVELHHRRSRALDPHIHRHLWLSVKVRGQDGRWSNVDSRVAMKLHTVINAEGELAARTDPTWIAALARHGFTLDADGEIAELAHAVRPLSRRSNQIERNRAVLLARWQEEHLAQEPTPTVLQQIDRMAWAKGRPNKPGDLREHDWESMVREELGAIDPELLGHRGEVRPAAASLAELDVELLAARAIVEADTRSAACGGRFSRFDIRAGATRALAASGVVQAREDLQGTLDLIEARALTHTVDLLPDAPDRPDHIKGFMAAGTAASKVELGARFDALTRQGVTVDAEEIAATAGNVLPVGVGLDERQLAAAGAIAGTDRLVSVTGPAGAGKTTMLRVAKIALAQRGHLMVVVAPTKKAASVAGREIGTTASSLHALLADYGWRWARDAAGAEVWTRLRPGDVDPGSGVVFEGPRRFPLRSGDRIVVDEAGMVDLHTANALAAVAAETGTGIAMVGDHLQAMPVGHAGAMACMTRRSTAVIELTAVHRFHDPEYAALTLRMREPASKEEALTVAAELDRRGLIHRVSDQVQARDVMVEAYFRFATGHRRVALVTGTNEEADGINEAIQQRRIDQGQLRTTRIALGQGEQRLLEGDTVQTRRNDRHANVDNRALWILRRITADGLELASVADSAEVRRVSHEYAAEHVHLAYASTVHGIQGETTDASIVGPGVDASGLYVGMTRGRAHNEAIAIAGTDAAARDTIAESMLRGIPEVSIDDSIRAARTELHRAARTPDTDTHAAPAAWKDRTRRPWGHVVEIERVAAQQRAREREMRERLERVNDWMHTAARTMLELDARIDTQSAATHGRVIDAATSAEAANGRRNQLAERYTARLQDQAQLAREYRQFTQLTDELEAERAARTVLDPQTRAVEDRARQSVAQMATAVTVTRGPDGPRRR
ncbi:MULTISPECIES: AAA family ATPase [unclassified Microbacterium]|uniref:AAA family ATPase n=1 Tax=unclassified Microbacterium TaxID=2609290 RepID=UPI00214C93B6|nr:MULTISPECIES: AAA family ATPase [unclassified Microbacterium]MCR2811295.1 AAA family ATPase [Microbacterium sp. zg.B185]WIM19452.1 AAA family ATPase [Microbacterium sp. zg-B185]